MNLKDYDNIDCMITKLGDLVVMVDETTQATQTTKNNTTNTIDTQVEYLVSAFYSQGQLLRGVEDGPYYLSELVSKAFGIKKHILIKPVCDTTHFESNWRDDYEKLYDTLKTLPMYILLGGDHSIGMSSVSASIYKTPNIKNLYIIWIDAHADMNTMEASITKNIHGQPLAGIMGYEDPWFNIKSKLEPTNLLYFGIRDLDDFEEKKILEHDIFNTRDTQQMLTKLDQIVKNNYEAVFHVSFDVDALDYTIMASTGCPVKNGLFPEDISKVYNFIKSRIIAFDLVEYNPSLGDTKISYNSIKTIIENISQ